MSFAAKAAVKFEAVYGAAEAAPFPNPDSLRAAETKPFSKH
jgi:hypothetical protein